MTDLEPKTLTLPALRGLMGDWVFYSCLINFDDLAERVRFADEIHNNKQLSDMIQRQLQLNRSTEIAEYIKNQNERFFNSLVIATYDGNPSWYALGDVSSSNHNVQIPELSEEQINSIGFLKFTGEEKLFAIDGQHRLAGIKKAVSTGEPQDPWDEASVIFVAHKNDASGKERTRRLFTTLNKTARPVSPGDIIALDEDDVMAIVTRKLIEESDLFADSRIAFFPTNNMPVSNSQSITTIGNLYKILTILFSTASHDLTKKKADLKKIRPPDEELKNYFDLAINFFTLMGKYFPEVGEFFDNSDYEQVTKKYRGNFGGNVLFRPIGIETFVMVIAHITKKDIAIEEAIKLASKLPRDITQEPFAKLLWDESTKTMATKQHAVTLREILLQMIGYSKLSDSVLLDKYRLATDNNNIELPTIN